MGQVQAVLAARGLADKLTIGNGSGLSTAR
jgi:hypothetical protein